MPIERKPMRYWRQFLLQRDGNRCCYCKCKMIKPKGRHQTNNTMTVEHIQPISEGGIHAAFNLKLACYWCNTHKKSTYSFRYWVHVRKPPELDWWNSRFRRSDYLNSFL